MGWIVLIVGCITIARIAEMEGRSAGMWGLIAFGSCMTAATLLPDLPMINLFIGLGLAFFAMFGLNFVAPAQRAAITR